MSPPAAVAVVGAGSIGVGWAVAFAAAGMPVRLHDPEPERLRAALGEVAARLHELAAHELLDGDPAPVAPAQTPAEAIAEADYVQECAPERRELKVALFAQLDGLAAPDVPLASSSSTMPAGTFAAQLPGRGRCLVVHPGNPPYLLPVAEVVPAEFTRREVVARTEELLRAAGLAPVRVRREVTGFVFNRLQGALLREAYCLVRDGVASVEDVDRIVRDGLGRRWSVIGPFETADLNTRGGIAEHAARLGPAYARMGAERGQCDEWTPELVAQVTIARRSALPLEEWDARVAWRDRALMRLARAHRRLGGA